MLKDLRSNNRGIVFVTVLIIILIAMILAVSALSLNISQVKNSEDELRYIQAKMLAEGGFARIYINQLSGTPSPTLLYTETLDNTTFIISSTINTGGVGPTGSGSFPAGTEVTF
jgi:Tfp pilus assembly protein PilX